VATILGTTTVVDTTMTDDDGLWSFSGLPTANEYLVTLSDTAGNAVSRAPWSGEMRELWVRDRLDVTGKPLVLDAAAGNSLAWTATGLYVPPVPTVDLTAYYTKTQSDTKFVDVTGDTMSGSLGIVNSTSTRISNVRAAGSLQRPGIDFERWKTTVDTIEEVAVGSTIGTFGFNASGATNLAYGGSIYAYVDAPIVGGTAPIAFSFYHATLGETYRLDSQGRGWFAPPADTSIFPATPGLYISGKWVGVSATAGNVLTWNADGFYVPTPAGGGGLTLPLTVPLTFSPDNTHDIGASGASRPNDLYLGGNIYMGTASRILANFGAITPTAGTAFQTNVTNGLTEVPALPNGTGTGAWYVTYNNSDPTNSASAFFGVDGTVIWFGSQKFGSGANLPLRFWVNSAERMGIATSGAITMPTGPLSVAGKTVGISATGGNLLTWNADGFYAAPPTDLWVDVAGDTMTGLLTQHGAAASTIVHQAKLPADTQPRFTIRADGQLNWGAGGSSATDIQIYRVTAGDFRINSVFSGSTNNTRDLGFASVQWKAIYANALYASGDGTASPAFAAAGALRLRNAAVGNIAWRNAGNTADLTLGANATDALAANTHLVASATNTLDLGTSSLRWRKLWATDIDVTNAPTVGGSALLTVTAGDTAYVNTTGDTMTGALTLQSDLDGSLNPMMSFYKGGAWGGRINTYNSRGTVASPSVSVANDEMGSFNWYGRGNTLYGRAVVLDATVEAVNGPSNIIQSRLGIWTQNAAGGLVERLRVDSAGLVSIPGTLTVNSRPVIMAGCRVTHNANQTLTTGVDTALAFNTERFDTDAFHDPVTNNTRLTVPAGMGGTYLIWASIEWAQVADVTWRAITLRVNGSVTIARASDLNTNSATFPLCQSVTATYDLVAGNYVEVTGRHERGSNLDVVIDGTHSPVFGWQRVG
jgi:hypothetical protein